MSNIGNKEILSSNLKKYMLLANKDRRQICTDLDIKYTTFTDWINGNKYPRIDKIELLANYFGVKKSDLIEEKPVQEDELSQKQQLLTEMFKGLNEDSQDILLDLAASLKRKQDQ